MWITAQAPTLNELPLNDIFVYLVVPERSKGVVLEQLFSLSPLLTHALPALSHTYETKKGGTRSTAMQPCRPTFFLCLHTLPSPPDSDRSDELIGKRKMTGMKKTRRNHTE